MSDTTETGLRIEGPYENDRNAAMSQCFKDVIREAFGVTDVIIAHHLVYVVSETHKDGFAYQVVEEIPSADALLFDHTVARKIWGGDYVPILSRLACESCESRDALFKQLYYGRKAAMRPAQVEKA